MDPKICLVLIVKNESKNIERCFTSVKSIIDCISVCDTGSTDETKSLIENWCQTNCMPYKVHYEEFKNFGYNRTKSYQLAKESFSQTDYFLLLDADMVVNIEDKFNKKDLIATSYMTIHYYGGMKLSNIRFISNKLRWICYGAVHEYWACLDPDDRKTIDNLTITIHPDNSGRDQVKKYQWYLKLIKDGIDNPTTIDGLKTRYYFYAGETEKILANYHSAIDYYHKRIDAGGWQEEVFYSYYQISNCYHKLCKLETDKEKKDNYLAQTIRYHLEAFNHTQRKEPLFKLARIYRKTDKFFLSYLFATKAKDLADTGALLFNDNRANDRLDYEISIVVSYLGKQDIGRQISDYILFHSKLPNHYMQSVHRNYLFYLLQPKFESHEIKVKTLENYHLTNISIGSKKNGYLVNYTMINEDIINDTKISDKIENRVYKRNFILNVDKNFAISNQNEIICKDIEGLENYRLITIGQTLYFLASDWNYKPESIANIYIGHFKYTNNDLIEISSLIILSNKDINRVEKNCLPFRPSITLNDDDNLFPFYILYSYQPLTIYQPRKDGSVKEIIKHDFGLNFSQFRHSSGPIPFDDGYLILIREIIVNENQYFAHRFIWLSIDFMTIKCSHLFFFQKKGLELCSGMCYNYKKDSIIFSVSLEDSSVWLFSLLVSEISPMLNKC